MQKRGASHHRESDPRAALWATLTIAAFPIVAMSMGWFGVDPFTSFVFGAAASLLVLITEGVLRGRWWVSDPAIARVLGDPALGYRLLVLVGIVILLFQSFLLVGFLTDGSFDANIVRFVLGRQCDSPSNQLLARLCREAAKPSANANLDLAAAAVREAAEKRFFPGGLVTCAARPLAQKSDSTNRLYGALVRCDRWAVSRIAGRPISVQTITKPVITLLTIKSDGTYRIDGWTDDPESPAWNAIGNSIAEETFEQSRAATQGQELDGQLATETFRRVMEKVSSN